MKSNSVQYFVEYHNLFDIDELSGRDSRTTNIFPANNAQEARSKSKSILRPIQKKLLPRGNRIQSFTLFKLQPLKFIVSRRGYKSIERFLK